MVFMKITELNQRVIMQKFEMHKQPDGDIKKEITDLGSGWVKITALKPSFSKGLNNEFLYKNQYRLDMQKNNTRYTRHAYPNRIIWNHKILNLLSPWQEIQCTQYLTAIAQEI